jgi:hypothetical protein
VSAFFSLSHLQSGYLPRTGLKGRGVLKNWKANYACDPVITRVDRSTSRHTQVLVCTSTAIPGLWCLPGGTIQNELGIPENLKLPDQRRLPDFLASLLIRNAQLNDANCTVEAFPVGMSGDDADSTGTGILLKAIKSCWRAKTREK